MIQSLNSKVELSLPATSYQGIDSYGDIMIGNIAFEYYQRQNVNHFVQIPYASIKEVQGYCLGKKILRFCIVTEKGNFTFSSQNNVEVLKLLRNHIGADKIVKAKTLQDYLKTE